MARPRTPPDQLNEIYPNLYLGDLTAAESPHVLEAYAITHIISLTSHRPKVPKNLGITKKHFRIRDNTASNLLSVLPECIQRLEYILSDTDGGVDDTGRRRRVLVHCRMGMSRSGGAVVAYVMKFAQCPAIVALEYVRQMRPIVNPNRAFMAQLELWGACSYDTSFLEDHEKYAHDDKEVEVDASDEVEVEDDDDLGEEALLMRALEMSLAGADGDVDADMDEAGAVVFEDDETEEGIEVEAGIEIEDNEMEEEIKTEKGVDADMPTASTPPNEPESTLPGTHPADLEPPLQPEASPAMADGPAQPESIPLPSSPDRDAKLVCANMQLQLEERRQSIREQREGADEGAEGWGQVVMRDGMKRCFEECLKDVDTEFESGVEGVS